MPVAKTNQLTEWKEVIAFGRNIILRGLGLIFAEEVGSEWDKRAVLKEAVHEFEWGVSNLRLAFKSYFESIMRPLQLLPRQMLERETKTRG